MRLSDAQPLLTKNLELVKQTYGENNITTLINMVTLGELHVKADRHELALSFLTPAVERARQAIPKHSFTGVAMMRLGGCLAAMGKFDRAIAGHLPGRIPANTRCG